MAEVEVKLCSNPGCDQPGTNQCSACKITVYCCVICQTADWPHHKEECSGYLRKVGQAHLDKALAFRREHNFVQTIRYSELAATKLKQLKDRRLETVEAIDKALECKFIALQRLVRYREAMECANERYTLWAMNQMRNPGSIYAALQLIESCLHNEEYEDAEHYARHAMFMINDMANNFIPVDKRSRYLADGSYYLATAVLQSAVFGGIPPGEKQKIGEEAIALARQALQLHTQLLGTESMYVANDMGVLAGALDFFNDHDDDETLRLYQQSIAITIRKEGSLSVNVAANEGNLGYAYNKRADRAEAANDLDRCMANLELALTHNRESARIYRATNHVDDADRSLRCITRMEEEMRQIGIARAAATSTRG